MLSQFLKRYSRSVLFVIIATATLIIGLACSNSTTPASAPAAPYVAPTAAPAATQAPIATSTPRPITVPADTGPKYGGVLRFPLTISIDAPDPHYSIFTGTRRILWLVYNSLVIQTATETVAPSLTKSWEVSGDGKEITFNLEKGVKFQDGTDFNAQAVKWNFDRMMDPEVQSPRKNQLIPLQRVEVVDDNTIKMYLEVAFRPFLANLTLRPGQISSPTAINAADSYADRNGDFGRNPVGTGPFVLDEWKPDRHFKLSRNPNYWEEGLPYLDGVYIPVIPDTSIQFAMLRTGELDIIEGMRPEDRPVIERNPNIKTVVHKGTSTYMLFFKMDMPPFDNQLIRNAIAKGIDRDIMTRVGFSNAAVPAYSVIGPSMNDWYDPDVTTNSYDPEGAKQLMAQAGYADGFSFTFPTRDRNLLKVEIIQTMLADIGINMNIITYETKTYWSDFVQDKHDGPLFTYFSPRPDPHILLRRLYHTKGAYGNNVFGYVDPKVDAMIDEAATVFDPIKAKQAYNGVLKTVAAEGPVIPLAWSNVFFAMGSDVIGFAPRPDRVPRLGFLWLDR